MLSGETIDLSPVSSCMEYFNRLKWGRLGEFTQRGKETIIEKNTYFYAFGNDVVCVRGM